MDNIREAPKGLVGIFKGKGGVFGEGGGRPEKSRVIGNAKKVQVSQEHT